MTRPTHKLGDICQTFTGGTPPRTKREYFGGGIPWVKITDMLQGVIVATDETLTEAGISNSSAKLLPPGTVLISIFATIGRTAVLDIEAATNQAIAGVVPKDTDQLEPRYLRYFLDSKYAELNRTARGVAQPNINQSILKALDIPLPPLPEQRRIVDLLSRAEGIVRLRREAEKKAAELIPALFIDMFGDPATNPKGWPVTPTGGLVKLTNGRAFKPTEWSKEGTPIIRIQNLNDPAKPFNYYEGALPEKYKIHSGDILLSWSGTPGTSFGCFRWKRQDGWLNQHIFKVEVDDGVDEEFFIHQINLRLPELIDRAHGGVGLQHFTKGELESLPFVTPPLHAQQRFRDQAEQALSIHDQQAAAGSKAQAAFDALLARAFAG